ncbi:hypothetical protein [Nonomuraea sp. LPB2021202275-12-8]|uniref:hypothetical protein n=1 Tax=Nonomuraea sp. LPB2021202275-12-8 TaxID=3120159 RepID=UPI00300CCA9B
MNFLTALRTVMALHVVAALFQSVTAGMLLSSADGRALHVASGLALAGIGAIHVLLSILVWRPGRGSPAFIPSAVILLAATAIAAMLGEAGIKELHLPLGVAIFGGTVVQLFRAMSSRTPAAA